MPWANHKHNTVDDWIYYRLYSDLHQDHYIGFLRTMPGEEDQYLMASDVFWGRQKHRYQSRLRLSTPPSNIRRIATR